MHETGTMGRLNSFGKCGDKSCRIHWWHDSALRKARQTTACHEFQYEKGLARDFACFVNRHDIGMLKTRQCLSFSTKAGLFALTGLCSQNFDRYNALQSLINGAIDDAESATPEFAKQFVARNLWPMFCVLPRIMRLEVFRQRGMT